MNGRVAVLKAYGGDFELREYPVPDPEPGAVLVRLTRAGVCGSDLHIWRGEMKEIYGALPRDLTFGHEMCGRVARLGAGVTVDSAGQPLGEGDRVAFLYFFPCRRCPVCLRDEMGSCPRKARANRVAGTAPYFNNGFGADIVADFVGYPEVVPEGLRVATSNYSPWALAPALAFLRRNLRRFPYERLISHVFPLARISEAFQQADWMQRAGDGLRISRAALSMAD